MSQPTYEDIGKLANDLLNKGYDIGLLKIKINNNKGNNKGNNKNYEFNASTIHNLQSEVLESKFSLKCKLPEYNTILTEKWTSKNILSTSLELFDHVAKGLALSLESHYDLCNNNRSAIFKTEYNTASYRFKNKLSLIGAPILNSSIIIGNKDAVSGVKILADINSMKIKSYDVSVSLTQPNYAITGFIMNGLLYGGSIFYKPGENVKLGAEVMVNQIDSTIYSAIASECNPSQDLNLKAKINNNLRVSVVAKHQITSSLSLIGSTHFSIFTSTNKPCKLGLGLEYST